MCNSVCTINHSRQQLHCLLSTVDSNCIAQYLLQIATSLLTIYRRQQLHCLLSTVDSNFTAYILCTVDSNILFNIYDRQQCRCSTVDSNFIAYYLPQIQQFHCFIYREIAIICCFIYYLPQIAISLLRPRDLGQATIYRRQQFHYLGPGTQARLLSTVDSNFITKAPGLRLGYYLPQIATSLVVYNCLLQTVFCWTNLIAQ